MPSHAVIKSWMGVPVEAGQIIAGPRFNEPMCVETVRAEGAGVRELGLAGKDSE